MCVQGYKYTYVHHNLFFLIQKYVTTQVSIKRALAKLTLTHTCSEILYSQLKHEINAHLVIENMCKNRWLRRWVLSGSGIFGEGALRFYLCNTVLVDFISFCIASVIWRSKQSFKEIIVMYLIAFQQPCISIISSLVSYNILILPGLWNWITSYYNTLNSIYKSITSTALALNYIQK